MIRTSGSAAFRSQLSPWMVHSQYTTLTDVTATAAAMGLEKLHATLQRPLMRYLTKVIVADHVDC